MKYIQRVILFGLLILAGCGDSGTNIIQEENALIFEGNTLIPNGSGVTLTNFEQRQKINDVPKISEQQKDAMRAILLNYSKRKNTTYVAFISSKKKEKFKYSYFKLRPGKSDIEQANGDSLFYFILFVNPQTYEAYRIIAAKIPKTENQKKAIQDWASKFGFKRENAKDEQRDKLVTMHCYWQDVYEWHEEYGYHGYTIWVCEEEQLDPGGDGGGTSGCYYEPGGCEEEPDPTDPTGGGGTGDDETTSCPTGQVKNENGNCIDLTNCETSANEIGEAFPSATIEAKDKLEEVINQNGEKFGIDNKYELQHFLAQAGHESGGFTDLLITENMNYSADRLLEIFSKYFSRTDPDKENPDSYAGDGEKIANYVYANRNGNGDIASGEGWKYRGRGIFQLSGKTNYQNFTSFYQDEFSSSVDFIQNPDKISSDMEFAILSAMWFYNENVLDEVIDDKTTVTEVTLEVNGGTNGLEDRKNKYQDVQQYIDECIN